MCRQLALSVCVLLLGCASAPSSDVPGDSQAGSPTVTIHEDLIGFTVCQEGVAESWIRHDHRDDPEVIAHEAEHREQFTVPGKSCAEAMNDRTMLEKYQDEIEAFCAGINASSVPDLLGIAKATRNIHKFYGFDVHPAHIAGDLIAECKT